MLFSKTMNEHSKLVNIEKSVKITDPSKTFIKREPDEDRIKVLIVPEFGKKKLVTVHLPNDYNCVVELLLVKLNEALAEHVEDIYLLTHSLDDVRYVVTIRSKQIFDKKVTKKKNFRDLTQGKAPKKYPRNFFEIKHFRKNVQIVLKYPLRPRRNEFVITTEDFKCLDECRYLNDMIINFYMNYLSTDSLVSKNKSKVYMFNTHFYTRLSTPKSMPEVRRYEQIKQWTKDVNIFEKEFIFIPVQHSDHWLLVILCYPGSIGTTRFIDTEEPTSENPKTSINRPCMLIFDSMIGLPINRLEIVNEIKSYLRYEYETKTGRPNFFEGEISVNYVDVPQQKDNSDCGVFLLHFVESFFKEFLCSRNKFSNLLSSKCKRWFDIDTIERKRKELKRLIVRLAVKSQRYS